MSEQDAVEFLTWLENVFPDRITFTDKAALASGFVNRMPDRNHG